MIIFIIDYLLRISTINHLLGMLGKIIKYKVFS